MDRARDAGVAPAGVGTPGGRAAPTPALGGGSLRRVLATAAVLAGAVACKALSPDFDAVIAIDVSLPDSIIDIGDTTHPAGFAVNGRGDSTPATLVWSALDTTVQVVDSLTGAAVGLVAGPGRLVARAGALRSNPVTVNVLGRLDSIVAVTPKVDIVAAPRDSLSLAVRAFSGGLPAARRRITVSFTFPPGGTGFTLVPVDTVTGANGIAAFVLRLTGARPDSAVATVSATYHGTQVANSPISFAVFFP